MLPVCHIVVIYNHPNSGDQTTSGSMIPVSMPLLKTPGSQPFIATLCGFEQDCPPPYTALFVFLLAALKRDDLIPPGLI